jgi:hypothetical protein
MPFPLHLSCPHLQEEQKKARALGEALQNDFKTLMELPTMLSDSRASDAFVERREARALDADKQRQRNWFSLP